MKLFLSFSFADREWVSEFATSLSDAGFEVLRSDSGVFSPGETIEASLLRSLEAADILIPVLTEHSVRNPNVMFELGFAKGLRKQVIPILVSEAGEQPAIPTDLSGQLFIRAETPDQATHQLKRYATEHATGA